MKKARTLSDQIEAKLLYQLMFGKYRLERRLPPETEIAKDFGVSRNALRSSMSVLERAGYISRKRGVGTIVNQHVLDIQTRIDFSDTFAKILKSTGKEPSCSYFKMEVEQVKPSVAKQLHIAEGSNVWCISRVMNAGDKPAVYCRDYVASDNIECLTKEDREESALRSTFDLLIEAEEPEIQMAVTEISAMAADEALVRLCGLEPGEPVLYMEAVHYTLKGKPLFVSQEHYMNDLSHMTIVRSKIYMEDDKDDGKARQ